MILIRGMKRGLASTWVVMIMVIDCEASSDCFSAAEMIDLGAIRKTARKILSGMRFLSQKKREKKINCYII